jgi:hypothetical protein
MHGSPLRWIMGTWRAFIFLGERTGSLLSAFSLSFS